MRGILLKNHVNETASHAALVMKVVPASRVPDMGAVIEMCRSTPKMSHRRASDLGHCGNMTHPGAIESAIATVKREGISDAYRPHDAEEPGAACYVVLSNFPGPAVECCTNHNRLARWN